MIRLRWIIIEVLFKKSIPGQDERAGNVVCVRGAGGAGGARDGGRRLRGAAQVSLSRMNHQIVT